jgi:hypothetical protein
MRHAIYSQLGRAMNENSNAAELTPSGFHDAIKPVLDGATNLKEISRLLNHLLTMPFGITA